MKSKHLLDLNSSVGNKLSYMWTGDKGTLLNEKKNRHRRWLKRYPAKHISAKTSNKQHKLAFNN